MKVSHTQVSTYQQCGEKWRLQYEEKLRGLTLSSPLFFGRAIDSAIMRLLLDKKKTLTDDETMSLEMTPIELFHKHMESTIFNYQNILLAKSEIPRYSASDLDLDVLTPNDLQKISEFGLDVGFSVSPVEITALLEDFRRQLKEEKKPLEVSDQRMWNYIHWLSLLRKGEMLIEAFGQQILPIIDEVYTIQEAVSLKDNDDELIGFIDFVASFKDEPGIPYVIDLKTASKAYKDDSVRTSDQLALYCEYKGIQKAAFIVIEKTLRKKAPRVRISVVRDTMPQQQIDNTFDKISMTIEGIQKRQFDKNKDSCYAFGKKCDYYGLCHFGSNKGLVSFKGVENVVNQKAPGGESETKTETTGIDGCSKETGCGGSSINRRIDV